MKVKATSKFKTDNVYPTELNGIVPEEGFIFELPEARANELKAKGYIEFIVETAKKEVKTEKATKKTTKTTKKSK